ncbi:ParB/RepB/Spo0J family partition protein [Sphingomonas koreensis]|uniref:ParB/RepB/Spo0J family partition protein n=1 Tax=Sphingomonas koreensis TaxID=93064 RepID=UPI00234F04E4|nr:ParB/RepB/Spo0J family partition protein [Sphingomonas koreensis]MDC7810133.1 ParB/RepB/Spo0J family partition protein [Sphingomonas koreensis]
MRLDFIPLDKLTVSKTNMRHGKRPPDVADILPTIRKRGVIVPLVVRPNCVPPKELDGGYEIVAGARRFTAAGIVAAERRAEGSEGDQQDDMLPCAILDSGDDADAIELSLIENVARLDPDEVTQWATFTRLVKEGRTPDDISATFGLPDLAVTRILALGNLLPRIRTLYTDDRIDRATIRHLTMASKRQQRDWLALLDDPEQRAPTGAQLKAWLLGGQTIPASIALFDVEASGLVTVADLFGEDRFFADAVTFWIAQDAAIAARREAYLAEGWGEVVIVPKNEHFASWEYEKRPKRKGGRVYIDVRATGEVGFHEGYVTRREAVRASKGDAAPVEKPKRPELTTAQQTYLDLHRFAAVRAALTGHPGVALRLMVAHLVAGSSLWSVRRQALVCRDAATQESVETCRGEAVFDERRRAVLALLGMDPERETVTGSSADDRRLVGIFLRLLDLPDAALGDVVVVAMGETLAAGDAAVEAVGLTLGLDMADWWQPDEAFFDLLRDKEVLGAMVAEVAGERIAAANAKEKGKTLKRIVTDHLDGVDGRTKVEHWVPRWMAFPPAAYTGRGGVGTVRANAKIGAARADLDASAEPDRDPDPTAPAGAVLSPEPDRSGEAVGANDGEGTPDALAA